MDLRRIAARRLSIAIYAVMIVSIQTGFGAGFDLSREFSRTNNPSGAWSFGWKGTATGAFSLLTLPWTVNSENGVTLHGWLLPAYYEPAVYANDSTNAATIGGGQGNLPPGSIWVHPGANGRPENLGVLRFSVPSNAVYRVEVNVSALYSGGLSGDTDFHVVKSDVELISVQLAPRTGTTYSNELSLASGETLDFAVGRGLDGNEYGSALKIAAVIISTNEITAPTNSPPPPPPPTYSDFNLSREFSRSNNPSGAWSFGWKATTSGAFSLLTLPWTANSDNGVPHHGWLLPSYYQPAVYANDSTNTATGGGGQAVLPPGTVWVHPGVNGRPENLGVVRFTAPSNSNYRVEAVANALFSGGLSGDTDFHVVLNGGEIFGAQVPARAGSSYSNVVALAAGETLEFAVGRGLDGNEYGSALKLQAILTPTTEAAGVTNPPPPPPPPTYNDFNIGREFSRSNNPSGAWSFGWKATTSGDFSLLAQPWTAISENGVLHHGWLLPTYYQPAVYANDSDTTATGAGGQVIVPPGMIWVHPGVNGRPENLGVVRFTAPSNGNYRVEATASALYSGGLSGDTDFHVVLKGGEIFGVQLPAHAGTSYSNVVALATGETLEFAIGRGTDGNEYGSALKLQAILTPTTEPPGATNQPPPPPPPSYNDFNLGREFSRSNNPSGAWSFGWKATTSGAFSLLTQQWTATSDNGVPLHGWLLPSYYQPAVYANDSVTTATISGGQSILPPGTVWAHPGVNGRPENLSVVRFTAPSNSNYRVEVFAYALFSGGLSGDTDFHVVLNGGDLFDVQVPARAGTSYSNVVTLAAGDTVEFAVGRGADGNEYGSALKLQAVLTPTTEPPGATNQPLPPPPPPPPAYGDFNLSREFSRSNNPSGAWSFGWKATTSGAFSLLTQPWTASSDNGVIHHGWLLPTYYQPAVYANDSTNPATGAGGQVMIAPGAVWVHPGVNGRPENLGVIRFTAPSNSNYRVETVANALYSGGLAGNTDFHVIMNGAELFGVQLAARAGSYYSNVLALTVGDTVDLAVGRGADANEYGSALKLQAIFTPTIEAPGSTNPPPPPPPPTPALVSLWHADGNAQDAIGANHGTVVNQVDFAPGVTGQAFHFNGAGFIRVPDHPSLHLTNGLTLQMWFQFDADLAWGTTFTLLDKRDFNTCSYGANMSHDLGFALYYNDPAFYDFEKLTTPLVTAGTWHHFAGTYRQKVNGVELIVYMDGSPVKTNTFPGTLAAAINTANLSIGAARNGASDYFRGSIDEIGLYNYPLSSSEVFSNYQSITPPVITNPPPPVMSDFVLGRDFSAANNPSGAWSYGWKQTPNGAFNPLPQRWTASLDNNVLVHGWLLPSFGQPAVYANDSASTGVGGGGQATLPPGTVWVHPGVNDRPENFGAVRFTCPSNGNYLVNLSANPLYSGGLSGDVDFHISTNGTEIFGQFLAARTGTAFSNILVLNSGDAVDFSVGRGADKNEYGSALKLAVAITPTTNAPTVVTNPPPPTNSVEAPVIVTQPASQAPDLGTVVTLSVVAQGAGPLGYQWLFNGGPIAGATQSVLVISNVQPANSGTYRVIVSNNAGSATSATATISVQEPENGGTIIFANTPNLVYDVGGVNPAPARSSLAVALFAGPNTNALQQIGGFVAFSLPGRFSGGIRSIPSVAPSQTAFLQVKVWDTEYGSTFEQALAAGGKSGVSPVFQSVLGGSLQPPGDLSAMPAFALSLLIAATPQITSDPQSTTVPLNQSASLTVTATGGGLAYQWFHNGAPKPGAVSASLNLSHAQKSDAGQYFAVVSNNGGSATSHVATLSVTVERTLAVVSPPDAHEGELVSVPIVLEGDGTVAGMTFMLHYNADLLSSPEVVWGAATSNGLQAANVEVLGQLRAVFALNTAVPAGTQTLAVVNFHARTVNTNSTGELMVDVVDAGNANGDAILFGTDVRNGTARVLAGPVVVGDNNGNGVLDIGDATLLIRLLAELDSVRPWDAQRNDLNQNAATDSADAIRILRTAAEIDAPVGDTKSAAKDATLPNGEIAVLSPSVARGSNGLVTFEVRLQNIRGSISGAAFTLNYPPNALRIPDPQAHVVGPLVPSGSAVIWNLAPTNNYAQQSGRIRFVASSATAWPSSTGAVAQITFQVQPGTTNEFAWPLSVSRVEVSALGYNRSIAGSSAIFAGRSPRVGRLAGNRRLGNGMFEFNVEGDLQATFAIEASSDLFNWTTITNVVNTTGTLQFTDPDAATMSQRFYRVRVLNP